MSLHLYLVTIGSCLLIGLSSMISLFIFSILINHQRNPFTRGTVTLTIDTFDPNKSEVLKTVLGFAVGGLLGDVFLHLLPEAAGQLRKNGFDPIEGQRYLGFWILVGVVLFITFESVFTQLHQIYAGEQELSALTNGKMSNGSAPKKRDNETNGQIPNGKTPKKKESPHANATGYLNLLANSFDNFTHGMAVGASFLAGYKMGILTTMAIAIHEIPHEITDYIILVRSGFTSLRAFRAQLSISLVTVFGALSVLYFENSDDTLNYTLWILPFTAGGFIYIAMGMLPELLDMPEEVEEVKEHKRVEVTIRNLMRLLQRLAFVVVGIVVMVVMNMLDY